MCDNIKQFQKAGDNSQQFQAKNITVINGIDEKRAREIFSEMYTVAKSELTEEAINTANERINKFENILIPKMEKIDGALNTFADPSFQVLLTKANKSAACTNVTTDYELLAELLVHRVQRNDSRKNKAGINRAIEIVDQITEEALNALTVFFSIETYTPKANTLEQGLKILDDLYKRLPIENLPNNTDWIEELDILDCARYSTITNLKKLEEYWKEKFEGFVSIGLKINSEKYNETIQKLEKNGLSKTLLMPNQLLDEYVVIPVIRKENINNLQIIQKTDMILNLTESQKKCLFEIYESYENDRDTMEKVKKNFVEKLEGFSSIKKCKIFWNNISYAIDITSVGKVLAHANAKHYDSSLPDLN